MRTILLALIGGFFSFSASAQQLSCMCWDDRTADEIIEVFNTTTNPYMECRVDEDVINVDPSFYDPGPPDPKFMAALDIGDNLGPRCVFRAASVGAEGFGAALTIAKNGPGGQQDVGFTQAELQICYDEAAVIAPQMTLCGGVPDPDPDPDPPEPDPDPPLECEGGADPVCPTDPVVCEPEANFSCEVQLLRNGTIVSSGTLQ